MKMRNYLSLPVSLILLLFLSESVYSSDGSLFQLQALSGNSGITAAPDPLTADEPSFRNQSASNLTRLKRAEMLALGSQLTGMALLQAADSWHTGYRPFSDSNDRLRRAWTTAPKWDNDSYFYNYIGHPYTGSFNYNLMRSQNASPLASWLFSCSQSLIWEFTFEATEQQPSIQDLLITSNVGSLIGEGFHRLTVRMRKNGLTLKEKIIVLLINPGHILNNGFR